MNKDIIVLSIISVGYVILYNKTHLFFSLVFLISLGSNYQSFTELFTTKSRLYSYGKLFFLYFIAYYLIRDPNPLYYLMFFYLPFDNYFKGLFILIFLSYSFSYNSKEYFLSKLLFKHYTIKRLFYFIISMIITKCLIFLYNDRLFIYFLNKETVIKNQKFYIVANLYNNDKILQDWINEMKELINYLGKNNVYISIFENGDSEDDTAGLLFGFSLYLDEINLPHKIITEKIIEKYYHERIIFLAMIRNKAMDFLYEIPNIDFERTKIIFFNDIIFNYEDIVNLIRSNGQDYDVVCGMDYYESFYDTWASLGLDGQTFRYYFPYFINKAAQDAYINGDLIRTFSCWNGVIVAKGGPFKDRGIVFRSAKRRIESECALINTDFYNSGHQKIIINPNLKFTYEYYYYYMNKYVYPWSKNPFTYFYYYCKYLFVGRNENMVNVYDDMIPLEQSMLYYKGVYLAKTEDFYHFDDDDNTK